MKRQQVMRNEQIMVEWGDSHMIEKLKKGEKFINPIPNCQII